MFSIMFTDAVLDHRNDIAFSDKGSVLDLRFGSLYLSVETLFRAISNGVTWGEAADALGGSSSLSGWKQQHFSGNVVLGLLLVLDLSHRDGCKLETGGGLDGASPFERSCFLHQYSLCQIGR